MEKDIVAIDISIPAKLINTKGTAFYRIDPGFHDFLLKCKNEHGVIGFMYDFDSLNFGVVLAPEAEPYRTEEEKEEEKELLKDLEKKKKEIKKKGGLKKKAVKKKK